MTGRAASLSPMTNSDMKLEIIAGPARTPEMAVTLERSGASIVAILPECLPRFGVDASVDLATAKAIRDSLGEARLCLLLDGRQEIPRLQDALSRLRPACVALDLRRTRSRVTLSS